MGYGFILNHSSDNNNNNNTFKTQLRFDVNTVTNNGM